MSQRIHLFFDLDDTLVDRDRHLQGYALHAGEALAAEMGGSSAKWAHTLALRLNEAMESYAATFIPQPQAPYRAWLAEERHRIVTALLSEAQTFPVESVHPKEFALRIQQGALEQCDFALPHAVEALESMSLAGYALNTASAQDSSWVYGTLIGMGVCAPFQCLFGPDLIDCAKESPEYYSRLLRSGEVDPTRAIVIDDQPECLEWAVSVGMLGLQARVAGNQPHWDGPGFEDWRKAMQLITRLCEAMQ